jgi:hypothetical protein
MPKVPPEYITAAIINQLNFTSHIPLSLASLKVAHYSYDTSYLLEHNSHQYDTELPQTLPDFYMYHSNKVTKLLAYFNIQNRNEDMID